MSVQEIKDWYRSETGREIPKGWDTNEEQCLSFISRDSYYVGYNDAKEKDEKHPSDEMIMLILNCIGYEEKSWIDFVRKELKKREDERVVS